MSLHRPAETTNMLALAMRAMQSPDSSGIMVGLASAFGDEGGGMVVANLNGCDVFTLSHGRFERTGSWDPHELETRILRLGNAGFWAQDNVEIVNVADGGVVYVVAKDSHGRLKALTLINAEYSADPAVQRLLEVVSSLLA